MGLKHRLVIGTVYAALSLVATHAAAQGDPQLERGKRLWANRGCGGCHGIGKRQAGPDLAGVEQRRTREWLYRWLQNTDDMLASDPTARTLLSEWKGIRMPKQNLSDQDVEAILAYLRSEEAKVKGRKRAG